MIRMNTNITPAGIQIFYHSKMFSIRIKLPIMRCSRGYCKNIIKSIKWLPHPYIPTILVYKHIILNDNYIITRCHPQPSIICLCLKYIRGIYYFSIILIYTIQNNCFGIISTSIQNNNKFIITYSIFSDSSNNFTN